MKEKISFTLILDDKVHHVVTYEGEYRNLMVLITDKVYVEGFGDCGGMGRCGTCLVASAHFQELQPLDRAQSTTLQKFGLLDQQLRLACQYLVTNDFQGMTIKVF